MQTADRVKHAMEVEPAERNVVEGVVGQVQQEFIADQNNDGNVNDSGVSDPIDDQGLVFIVSHVDIDRDLNIAKYCVSYYVRRTESKTHVDDRHNDPPNLVSPDHSTVDVLVLVMVVALFLLLKNGDVSGDRALQALLVAAVAASFFEIGLRPVERVLTRVERRPPQCSRRECDGYWSHAHARQSRHRWDI